MTAVAIFVKTPGVSPIKTRLAAGIGPERAAAFYRLALTCVREVAVASGLEAYWAVAEEQALSSWSDLPAIAQLSGGLGARLDHVYSTLLARHGRVLLIGADAPQLTADLLLAGAAATTPYVMGRADDGGFWLFGGTQPVSAAVWNGVVYSTDRTADLLLAALVGEVSFVVPLRDVDQSEDLTALAGLLAGMEHPTAGQRRLEAWIRKGAVLL